MSRSPVKGQMIKAAILTGVGALMVSAGGILNDKLLLVVGAILMLLAPYLAVYWEVRSQRRDHS